MRRSLAGGACVIAACGFQPTRVTGGADAPTDTTDGAPAPPDACLPALGPACGGKLWVADFSRDPTTLDANCDGVADFHMRNLPTLPGTLQSGVWAEPGSTIEPLDTQAPQSFLTRTVVEASMRNTQVGATGHGAVVWINVDYDGTYMAPVFVALELDGTGEQTASLYGKIGPGSETFITNFTGLDSGFHTVHLDIDPPATQVSFSVDNSIVIDTNFYKFVAGPNMDKWATVVAYGSDAEFDRFSVEVCP